MTAEESLETIVDLVAKASSSHQRVTRFAAFSCPGRYVVDDIKTLATSYDELDFISFRKLIGLDN
tara:strand:- start:1213 stop:1407 length:195 start_codon:yes stop_codon:yes gene_type:complete